MSEMQRFLICFIFTVPLVFSHTSTQINQTTPSSPSLNIPSKYFFTNISLRSKEKSHLFIKIRICIALKSVVVVCLLDFLRLFASKKFPQQKSLRHYVSILKPLKLRFSVASGNSYFAI